MHVITHSRIVEAQRAFPRHARALDVWYRLMKRGQYRHFADLRATFGAVDKVGSFYVFDISGNALRVIAAVHFNRGRIYVRHILTHADYGRGAWKAEGRLQ